MIHVRSESVWLEGYDDSDHIWKTHGFREFDKNNDPAAIKDLSLAKSWFQEGVDTEHELSSPKPTKPVLFDSIPPGVCTNSSDTQSTLKFFLTGTWDKKKLMDTPTKIQLSSPYNLLLMLVPKIILIKWKHGVYVQDKQLQMSQLN